MWSDCSLPWLALPSWSGRWVCAVPRFSVETEYLWINPAPPPQTASCCLESAAGGTRTTRCRRGSPETERHFKSREAVEVFETYTFTEVFLYLWGVDDLPQGPHQGTVHSHQLLGLDLIGFVQHNPGEQRQCCFEGNVALTSFNLPACPQGTWSCPRGSSGPLSHPRTHQRCPVCGHQTAIWSDPPSLQTTPRQLQSHSLSGGRDNQINEGCLQTV